MGSDDEIIEEKTGPPYRAIAPGPELDLEKYRSLITDECVTQEEADELLRILWNMAATFARMGLGLDPVQMLFGERLKESWDNAKEGGDDERK